MKKKTLWLVGYLGEMFYIVKNDASDGTKLKPSKNEVLDAYCDQVRTNVFNTSKLTITPASWVTAPDDVGYYNISSSVLGDTGWDMHCIPYGDSEDKTIKGLALEQLRDPVLDLVVEINGKKYKYVPVED